MGVSEERPSFDVTYRRADGEEIGYYGWMTSDDFLDDEEVPVEVIEERWERVSVRRYWHLPHALYSCTADLECDEDAVKWVRVGDRWEQACKEHAEVSLSEQEGTIVIENERRMMTADEARRLGFTIDRHTYPWIAYKGPRFDPDEWEQIVTPSDEQPRVVPTPADGGRQRDELATADRYSQAELPESHDTSSESQE